MHWVADGGVEGYMEGRVNPHDGMPICLDVNTCAVTNSDVLFHTDSARLTHSGRAQLEQFFPLRRRLRLRHLRPHLTAALRTNTTCRLGGVCSASAAPLRSPMSPARSAPASRARIGYGERRPVATNSTAAGMQQKPPRRNRVLPVRGMGNMKNDLESLRPCWLRPSGLGLRRRVRVAPTRPTGPAPIVAIGEDLGRDAGSLSQLEAGIYIDPRWLPHLDDRRRSRGLLVAAS